MATLTMRGYAKHRKELGLPGTCLKSVQRALKRGWIAAERGGGIEPREADRRWAELHIPRFVVSPGGLTTGKRERRPPLPAVLVAHNALVDLLGGLVLRINACLQETIKRLPAGFDFRTRAWPALWVELDKLPAAIHTLRDEVRALLISLAEAQQPKEDGAEAQPTATTATPRSRPAADSVRARTDVQAAP